MTPQEFINKMQAELRKAGLNATVGAFEIGPQGVREIKAEEIAPEPTTHRCAGLHPDCPVCKGAFCLGAAKDAASRFGQSACCPHCGSFMRLTGTLEAPVMVALTMDDVIAMPDSERNGLMRARRLAERLNGLADDEVKP